MQVYLFFILLIRSPVSWLQHPVRPDLLQMAHESKWGYKTEKTTAEV